MTRPDPITAIDEPTSDDAVVSANAGETVYRELKGRLVRGEFAAGERLAEKRLATSLGVSRTPVRETLARLFTEGFVQRYSGGGFVPVIPDLRSIRELYQVRIALESWAMGQLAQAGGRYDRTGLFGLREEWVSLAVPADDATLDPSLVDLDERFHLVIAATAGNLELVDHLRSINDRIRPVRAHDFLRVERVAVAVHEHLAIVDPLIAGDVATAEQRLVEHLAETLALVEGQAALAIAAMVAPRR